MKKRTFYATFLLFLTAIYTSILSLSVITLKGTMQQARQQCLNEQYFIASALYRDMAALEDRGLASQEELDSLMQPYLYLAGNRRSALLYTEITHFYTPQGTAVIWRRHLPEIRVRTAPWPLAKKARKHCAAPGVLCPGPTTAFKSSIRLISRST